jgi:general stress protein 26
MTQGPWNDDALRRIGELTRDIDICMLVTRADGGLRGRPMSNNGEVEYDGDTWFFSYRDTPKVDEIGADPRVALAYVATELGTWLSIEGTAVVVEDDERKRELWQEDLKTWFEAGPDDDRLVLIKVRADRVHGWAEGEEFAMEPGQEVTRIERRAEEPSQS